MTNITKEQFAEDVAHHQMRVIREDGIYRHLRFQVPGTWNQCFDIVTWPGHLCYTGDMGSYLFSRTPDMFEFFRRDGPNFQYWAEKCLARDRDGVLEYSPDLFRRNIKDWFDDYEFDSDQERADAWQAVEDEVLTRADDGHILAVDAALNCTFGRRNLFSDFHESRVEEYTGRFQWCCHALPWAIALYDAARAPIQTDVA